MPQCELNGQFNLAEEAGLAAVGAEDARWKFWHCRQSPQRWPCTLVVAPIVPLPEGLNDRITSPTKAGTLLETAKMKTFLRETWATRYDHAAWQQRPVAIYFRGLVPGPRVAGGHRSFNRTGSSHSPWDMSLDDMNRRMTHYADPLDFRHPALSIHGSRRASALHEDNMELGRIYSDGFAPTLRRAALRLSRAPLGTFAGEVLTRSSPAPPDQVWSELLASRYCVVVRGQRLVTQQLFAALAAGCVPILIADWS